METALGSYLYRSLVPFLVLGLIVLLMRWTFSSGGSLVQRRPRSGDVGEYGLLVAVCRPGTMAEGEAMQRTLAANGLRATLVKAQDGPAVMVFATDEAKAQRILALDQDG